MYKKYCTGCGLCSSAGKVELTYDERGFLRAKTVSKTQAEFLSSVCPSGGKQCCDMDSSKIWGREEAVYLSYSTDDAIRHLASSGGVLTAIAVYLIENHIVDGIIQTKQDDDCPIGTVTVCSTNRKEIMECSGSRYSSSAPLINIEQYVGRGKRYAFIGKPCDVTALRNYAKINSDINESFPIMLSFFCAGAPSRNANLDLLRKLKCDLNDCVSLRYRGDGWPGYATAINRNGVETKLTYREAWRDTLGRDIREICRFCLDGIGEMADIACGDAWYLDKDNKPVFDEADGRNVVLCRTPQGHDIFRDAVKKGYLYAEDYEHYQAEMKHYQAYQFERRGGMLATFFAMRLALKATPKYNRKLLKAYASNLSKDRRFGRFKGTVKRILQRKI